MYLSTACTEHRRYLLNSMLNGANYCLKSSTALLDNKPLTQFRLENDEPGMGSIPDWKLRTPEELILPHSL